MDVTPELYQSLQEIARRKRLVSPPEVSSVLQLSSSECQQLLDQLVDEGLLRRTTSRKGQAFYWLAIGIKPGRMSD